MGRSPCCDKVGLKKGPWTPEEDQKLLAYIEEHGHGNWRALPSKAGLQRCGKSCRLRWTNYLRPDIKRGKFSLQEEQTIIQLHALLGNRWSAIATHLPKRTDNEIKNYWNTHLKKRLTKMGIDPITHKPKNDALLSNDGQINKNASNLSHMAQWESARLEAEARLVRQSKLIPTMSTSTTTTTTAAHQLVLNTTTSNNILQPQAWHGTVKWAKAGTSHDPDNNDHAVTAVAAPSTGATAAVGGAAAASTGAHTIESPTSTLSFSENGAPLNPATGPRTAAGTAGAIIEFMADSDNNNINNTNSNNDSAAAFIKEERSHELDQSTWKSFGNSSNHHDQIAPTLSDDHYTTHDVIENSMYNTSAGDDVLHDMALPTVIETSTWTSATATTRAGDGQHCIGNNSNHHSVGNFIENFTELLLSNTVVDHTSLSNSTTGDGTGDGNGAPNDDNSGGDAGGSGGGGSGCSSGDFYEDNKNYWNSILNLVNSSPSSSPLF